MIGNVTPRGAATAGMAASTRYRGRRWWLISRCANGRTEVLTVLRGAVTLPVFSFEEEARLFLEFEGLVPGGWRVRESTEGISPLYDPCVRGRRVALDPLPERLAGSAAMYLTCTERKVFLAHLLGDNSKPAA
jgi:hypothetical protein